MKATHSLSLLLSLHLIC